MKSSLGLFVLLVLFVSGNSIPVRGQEAVATPTEAAPKAAGAKSEGAKRADGEPAVLASKPTAGQPALQPLTLTLGFSNGKSLSGVLLDVTEWPMKTSFGPATLPLSSVAGIRFAQEGNATTTVVLHNGDSITGAIEVDHVEIETEWGKAQVNTAHVASLLFTPGLKWASEKGLNGVRWRLVESTEKDAAEVTAASYTTPRVSSAPNSVSSATLATPPAASGSPVFNNGGTVIRRGPPPTPTR